MLSSSCSAARRAPRSATHTRPNLRCDAAADHAAPFWHRIRGTIWCRARALSKMCRVSRYGLASRIRARFRA
eukprot:6575937-Lingulodinium_polyedra.AAC.1